MEPNVEIPAVTINDSQKIGQARSQRSRHTCLLRVCMAEERHRDRFDDCKKMDFRH